KLKLPPSKEYLGQEIDNIIEACHIIGKQVLGGGLADLNVAQIKSYNKLVLKNLPLDEAVIPGEIRQHDVFVGRYKGAPPQDCEFLVEGLCKWINSEIAVPQGYEIAFGIIKAILAHIYIAWIHPFADGNGRTARLIEFQILLGVGIPATAVHLLSNHYNQTRSEYYRQLDIAHKSGGNIFPFLDYALRGFIDGLKEQIDAIKKQQMAVHWINYVHSIFKDRDSVTDLRRKRLVLDLAGQNAPVPLAQVRYITPRIAETYARKTEKTVKRDINALKTMNLIEQDSGAIRAKQEVMLAFLSPIRKSKGPQAANKD
ncbi:MAG: Fic family protein, partial [Candidatus Krumholzibacteria bacterium]|nr:Fic family protein [Candidatus Krumholzibacteria bacterium]